MTQFWLPAGLLAAVALAFMLVPLWQQRRRSGRTPRGPLLLAAATVPLAVALYLHTTTWVPGASAGAEPEVEQMLEALAERLAQNPENPEGWRLLGRSYLSLGRYADAEHALRQSMERTALPDNELKLALAEAQVLQDPARLAGEAGQLIEEVLTSDPQNMRALWYGGLAALGGQQPDLARERWESLLALNPPPAIVSMLQAQLAELGDQPGMAGSSATIELDIRLAPDLVLPAPSATAALFVFARAPDGGPPVAAVRAPPDSVPGRIALSDANAMLPGRSLSDFEELTLVARWSQSGQPTAQPGDLVGERSFRRGSDAIPLELVIDRVQ